MNLAAKPINQASDGELKFQPNILDFFDNPTYHFKLYMLNFADVLGRNYHSTETTLIAESGVTADICIEDVSYESHLAISPRYESGVATNFNIQLREPYGVSLLDRLKKFAEANGVPDFTKIPYILELSFKAHNNDAFIPSDILKDKVWRWKLLFAKVDITVNSAGATYDITAQAYGDFATADSYGVLNEPISVTATDLGDFGVKFGEALDAANNLDVCMPSNKWNFKFDPELSSSPIRPTQYSGADGTTFVTSDNAPNAVTIQFSKGTSIQKALETVVSNSSKMQEMATGEDKQDESDNTTRPKFLFRTYTDVDILGHSEVTNGYLYEFTFYVKHYFVTNVALTPPPPGDSPALLDNILRYSTLKKRYDYIFTGMNDQVYSFDMRFNMAFFYAVPKQSGINTSAKGSTQAGAAAGNENAQAEHNADVKAKAKALKANTGKETTGGEMPQTYITQPVATGMAGGTQGGGDPGVSVMSALFSQAKSSDLAKLDITIKGDPYWLEPKPVRVGIDEREDFFATMETQPMNDNFSVYTKSGYVFVYFNSNNPSVDTAFEGNIVQNNIINGLYYIFKIRSIFYKGTFKQELELHRNFEIDMSNADVRKRLGEMNGDA